MIRPKFLLVCLDVFLVYLAFHGANLIRFGSWDGDFYSPGVLRFMLLLCFLIPFTYFFELYEWRNFYKRRFLYSRTLSIALFVFLSLSVVFFVFPDIQFGRGHIFIILLLFGLLQFGSRTIISRSSGAAQFANRIFIIGCGSLAQRIYDVIPDDHNVHSYARFVSCTEREPIIDSELVVGHIDEIDRLIKEYRPTKLITALSERRGNLPLREFMHSKLRGVDIVDATTFFEQMTGCLLVENMQPSEFVYTDRFKMTAFMRSYKRLYDILFSSLGLLLTLPFFPFIALLVKLDSPGSIFFKQLRVGEGEIEFYVYKFRTMTQNAEAATGAVWAEKDDPRVTRMGKFMRKTRIDEIPQLYNVLVGDMSFIGPRPERMTFVNRLKDMIPFYSTRHFVKPGVTGWAQVRYPYGASDEDALEKLRYDLFYIKNYSVFLDFKIIIDTIRVVVTGFGGR